MENVQEYLETRILTATPYRLHLLVIDGALRFAHQGLAALEQEDWETLDLALSRSRDCVSELIAGLRAEGPASAVIEDQKVLFAFVFRNLAMADPLRSGSHIESAIRILNVYRDTWLELGESLQETPADTVPPPLSRSWST